jgi:hypothetical protein
LYFPCFPYVQKAFFDQRTKSSSWDWEQNS